MEWSSFLLLGLILGWGTAAIIFASIIKKKTHQNNYRTEHLINEKLVTEKNLNQLLVKYAKLESEINFSNQQNITLQKQLNEQQQQLTHEFENIANRILKQSGEEISIQQHQKMNDLLSPLKEKIHQFEKRVEETYQKELRDKLDLQNEVRRLYELNQKISSEANNLTKALKGDIKKMGSWGELILERILEQSGLTKGREYLCEVHTTNSSGNTIRPDVIIHLPDNKHLIIDSKLSLTAYERFVNADSQEEQNDALKAHLESMKMHIKTLHEKNYSSSLNHNSPDFVLMFIPVEASFAAAVEADANLFAMAWEKQIVPVSPSTLLATLRTIATIWKQENQNRNALEIARQSGVMYDKLAGFVTDMEKIGKGIESVHENYHSAMNKLSYGNGNLISKAEKIKELGAKSSKQISLKYVNNENESLPN